MTDLSMRLSSPEADAPKLVDPTLQARRQKLRKIVVWVVGGASLLTCVGLVRAASRPRTDLSSTEASLSPPQASAPLVAPRPLAEPPAAADPAPPTTAVATAPAVPTVKPASARAVKPFKRSPKHAAPAKSTIARHW